MAGAEPDPYRLRPEDVEEPPSSLRRALSRLGPGMVLAAAIVGSGESVAARIRDYVAEGIDTFIFSGYPHLEESQRFGQYVMPHFAGEAAVPTAPAERELVSA